MPKLEEISLQEIFEKPDEWAEKQIITIVEYLGWSGEDCDLTKSSMRTRSDVTLKQGEYCIFCDLIPGLNPWKDRKKIKIKATVEIFVGRPRLRNPEVLEIIE